MHLYSPIRDQNEKLKLHYSFRKEDILREYFWNYFYLLKNIFFLSDSERLPCYIALAKMGW